jgi:hypothetical protein
MFHDFPFQFPECLQHGGHSTGMNIVVEQWDTLWQSLSFRADCRLQPSLKHVTIGCTCDNFSAFQVDLRTRPYRIPEDVQHQFVWQLLHFEFLCNSRWHLHCVIFCLYSGWQWWIQVPSPWWSVAENCHLLHVTAPSGRNKYLGASAYAHSSLH